MITIHDKMKYIMEKYKGSSKDKNLDKGAYFNNQWNVGISKQFSMLS